jgi:hypothetical protein
MACMSVKRNGLAAICGAGGWGAGSFEWINELTQGSISDGKTKVKGKNEIKRQRRNEKKRMRSLIRSLTASTVQGRIDLAPFGS